MKNTHGLCSNLSLCHKNITEVSAQLEIFSINKDPKTFPSDTLVYTVIRQKHSSLYLERLSHPWHPES